MKKILYLFSDTGGGHRASAYALIDAAKHLHHEKVHQEMVDVFAECSGFLNFIMKLYGPVTKHVPQFWGALWHFLQSPKSFRRIERMAWPLIRKNLPKLILEKQPDIIVSVHPLLNHVTVRTLQKMKSSIPFITVVTDPVTFHRSWVDHNVDALIVATPEAKKLALKYGMPESKIKVLGLPIAPKFALTDEEKAKHRVKDHMSKFFTVLMMGGGEGSGKMHHIIQAIEEENLKVQLIVIAGRNKKLEEKLRRETRNFSTPMKILGFTDKVMELMSESDIIITKAGPGTIAEALAMNLPMIITSWLPGQEEGNVEFVKNEDVGYVSRDPEKIAKLVEKLQKDRKEFHRLKENIKKVRNPHASFSIARFILEHAEKK